MCIAPHRSHEGFCWVSVREWEVLKNGKWRTFLFRFSIYDIIGELIYVGLINGEAPGPILHDKKRESLQLFGRAPMRTS